MLLNDDDIAAAKAALDELGFLRYLRPGEIEKLIAEFGKMEVRKGEVLITEGKSGEIFYTLSSGAVGIYIKRPLLNKLAIELKAPACFGQMWMVGAEPRGVVVAGEEDCILYTLLKDTFWDVLMGNPHVALLIQRMGDKRRAAILAADQGDRKQK